MSNTMGNKVNKIGTINANAADDNYIFLYFILHV